MYDKMHSEKVIEIIESILGNRIEELTFYELIMIYMSAYLHDSAMTMLKWEYDVLKVVEGIEQVRDNTFTFYIENDFKSVHKYSEILKLVKEKKLKILICGIPMFRFGLCLK